MKKLNLLVTREIPNPLWNKLEEYYDIEINSRDEPLSRENLKKSIRNRDALISLLSDPLQADVLAEADKLKIIAQYAAGYDNIDVEYASAKGIIVTNTPGVLTEATADTAWGLLIAVSRRLAEADHYVRSGLWEHGWGPKLLLGTDVYGKTLGIIGLGRIGLAVARRASGFNMRILYYNRKRRVDAERSLNLEYAELKTLLKEADFITLHTPLTEKTFHLIGESELRVMKRSAYIINTSRGKVIDEKALIRALRENWISGAGLDVFSNEPIEKDNPLLKLKNVVLTPHVGSASIEAREKMGETVTVNLTSFARGLKPPNAVNF